MTELELQRIVDGEMTGDERARILVQLDEQSPLWRSLALELLADQDLRRCFRQSKPIHVSPAAEGVVTHVASSNSNRAARWSLVMAASLLAIIIGGAWWWQMDRLKTATPSSEPLATNDTGKKQIMPKHEMIPNRDSEEPMLVNWHPTGKMRLSAQDESQEPLELPVYEVEKLSPESIINQQLAELEKLTEQYQQQGWRAGLDTHVYEGQLEDGRKVFIPVNVMHLEPICY